MRAEVAQHVYRVIDRGLNLRERLKKGDRLNFGEEQARLTGDLNAVDTRHWPEFDGDSIHVGPNIVPKGQNAFLGIRYALTCWLDEIFILDSPWSSDWNEHQLELSLYKTLDRAQQFWEQARRAETRPGTDALEVYYLCVMLGFRGDLRDDPERLERWAAATRRRITDSPGHKYPVPEGRDFETFVPPRHGRQRFGRMVLVATAVVLAVIFAAAFLAVISQR